jgi:hypothetical protein
MPLPRRHVFGPLLTLPAGTAAPWQSIPIPKHGDAGWYRVRKSVEAPGEEDESIPLRRVFRVFVRRSS